MSRSLSAFLAVALLPLALTTRAAELRVANRADFVSMDPYAQRDSLQLDVLGNVYEPLVSRDAQYRLTPALARAWEARSDTVWRFHLRQGVHFHDGSPFGADDVLFSFRRASAPGSRVAALVDPIERVERIDDHTVDFHLKSVTPVFPDTLGSWYMLSHRWFSTHGDAAAATTENGTGPFVLLERHPGERSRFARHASYWARVEGNVQQVTYLPIPDDQARVQALLSGAVDVIDPMPMSARPLVQAKGGLQTWQGPELRMIFLGMDQQRDELLFSDVKGRNPFKDRRVRQALYQAIDIDGLIREVLQGAAIPRATLVPPQLRGYAPPLERRLPYQPARSRQLLRAAGYAKGFGVTLDCPNDRYLNDEAVCRRVAADLGRVGVRVEVRARTKSEHFKDVLSGHTSFYLLGAASATGDAHNMLYPLIGSSSPEGRGDLNAGGYRNDAVDTLLDQAGRESDEGRRHAQLAQAMALHANDIGHLPLYQQTLHWAGRQGITLVQQPEGGMPWRYIRMPHP